MQLTHSMIIRELGIDCSWQTRPMKRIKDGSETPQIRDMHWVVFVSVGIALGASGV